MKKDAKLTQRIRAIRSIHTRLPTAKNIQVNEAPKVVVVFGPPKTGKSTLIRTLVKNFTKQRLNNIIGPITTVAGNSLFLISIYIVFYS